MWSVKVFTLNLVNQEVLLLFSFLSLEIFTAALNYPDGCDTTLTSRALMTGEKPFLYQLRFPVPWALVPMSYVSCLGLLAKIINMQHVYLLRKCSISIGKIFVEILNTFFNSTHNFIVLKELVNFVTLQFQFDIWYRIDLV